MTVNAEIDLNATMDVKALARELTQLRSEFAELSDKVEDYVADAEADLVNGAQRIGRRAWEVAGRDATYVLDEIEQNPVVAVSVALAIGALIGIFFTVRSR